MNNLLSLEQQVAIEDCMQNYDGTICVDRASCLGEINRRIIPPVEEHVFLQIIAICILALNMEK